MLPVLNLAELHSAAVRRTLHRKLPLFLDRAIHPLFQIRDAALDLLRSRFQALPTLIRKGVMGLQCLLDTAVDFRQLFRRKKGAAGTRPERTAKSCLAALQLAVPAPGP